MTPVWRKAPFLLLRFPGLFFALAAAVAVLALGAASQPLFIASAAGAALQGEFAQFDAATVGLQIETYGIPEPSKLQAAEEAIDLEADKVARLGDPTLTLDGDDVTIVRGDEARLPLFARSGAVEHLPVVDGTAGSKGLWVARTVANELGIAAGDEIRIRYGGTTATAPVGGIYRDLADVLKTPFWNPPDPLPDDDPVTQYWRPLGRRVILPTPLGPSVLPPLLLGDRETVTTLATDLRLPAGAEWSFPYDISDPALSELQSSLPALRNLEGRANDPLNPLGKALRGVHLYQGSIAVHSFLPGVADRVAASVDALAAPVRALSLAAQGLALLVVAVAAAFAAQRRAVELRLLVVQGVATWAQGAKAAIEAIAPAVVGAGLGWAAAVALVRVVGPSPDIASDVVNAALWRAVTSAVVPVLVVGLVTAAAARAQAVEGSSRLRGLAARAPWETMLLVLAGAAYFQVAGAATGDDEPTLSGLVLLFPLLLIAGGAGLVSRVLARLLPRLQGGRHGAGSAALYLARRRLAAAPRSALLLVSAGAISIGVLVFAATAADTTSKSLDLKAAVSVGSDVSVELGRDPALELEHPSTSVAREEADILGTAGGELRVDVLAVESTTLPEAATWSTEFATTPLGDLMARLTSEGERFPVIATGGNLPAEGTLTTGRYQLPIEVVARVRAFPGMSNEQPTIIVDLERFVGAIEELGTSSVGERYFLEAAQWVRGDPDEIVAALYDLGVTEEQLTTVAVLRSRPDLLARSWTLGYLQAVGLVSGLLAFVGTLLYLAAKQSSREVSYVLARRMGLTAGSHRLSVAGELAGMLGIATVTGTALALLAARILLPRLDPLPDLQPAATLAVPGSLLLAMVGAMLLACVIGAAAVQQAADRARVSEVLRVAT